MTFFMKLVSAILHPLLMATYLMFVLYFSVPELFGTIGYNQIPLLILSTVLVTFVIPGALMGLMRLFSKISSLELSSREERFSPFLTITMFYGAATYMFISELRVSGIFAMMMILVTCLIFSLSIITLKFKISIHAAANWATTGILAFLLMSYSGTLFYPLIISIFCSGLVSTSRLYQGLHTPREIWAGSIYGFSFCFLGLFLFT